MQFILASEIENLSKQWELDIYEVYLKKHIIVYHSSNWDGGFDNQNNDEEVIKFHSDFEEMCSVFMEFLEQLEVSQCILGRFYNNYLFERWSDANEIDIFKELRLLFKSYGLKRIDSKHGLLITIKENIDLIKKVIEANFRFLSNIGIFLPEKGILIVPTHHFEYHVYSPNVEKYLKILEEIAIKFKNVKTDRFINEF